MIRLVTETVSHHEGGGFDFSEIQELPFGFFSFAISRVSSIKARKIKNEVDMEV